MIGFLSKVADVRSKVAALQSKVAAVFDSVVKIRHFHYKNDCCSIDTTEPTSTATFDRRTVTFDHSELKASVNFPTIWNLKQTNLGATCLFAAYLLQFHQDITDRVALSLGMISRPVYTINSKSHAGMIALR